MQAEVLQVSQKSLNFAPANMNHMTVVQQYLMTFKPAQQKLVCLYAYIGQHLSDDDRVQLSVHGACMLGELPLLTAALIEEGFVVHEPANHFSPDRQFIRPRFYGEVMRFGLDNHPEWFKEFDEWPLTRYPEFDELQRCVRICHNGKRPMPMVLNSTLPPYLISLADDRRYEPLVTMIRDMDFPAFLSAVLRKWMKEDIRDVEEMIPRQLNLRKLDSTDPDVREMKGLVNYYNFVVQGQYTPPTSIRMTSSDYLSKGVHAMAQGKSELAMKIFNEASNNKLAKSKTATDPYPTDPIVAFYWVIALWTSKQNDARKTLSAFAELMRERNLFRMGAAILLADTLANPLQRTDMDLLSRLLNPMTLEEREYILTQHLVQLLATTMAGLPLPGDYKPQAAFLRHEAQAHIKLEKFEKKILTNSFGAKPVSSFVKMKDPWELMLDRLIASESKRKDPDDEGEHRVMYTIMSDGESVELREQNRLKDGRWGSGKLLAWGRFMSGVEPFMDRTDQAVVADIRFLGATRLTVGMILPHLVGSDRVYTGEQTPFRRVTIEEQKPYVIVERTADGGFQIQSNVAIQDLFSQNNVYHRDTAMHYIYYPMSDRERHLLQELLTVPVFPAEAEEKLRKLLPLISQVTDIHSDLLPEEKELETLEAQTQILIRLTPDPTTQTMFDAYVLVRPLMGGKMALPPAQGDAIIIDQNDTSGRVRIERDMEGEARNLTTLLQYCQEHGIELSEKLAAHLSTPQVLQLLAFVSSHPEMSAVEWPEGERLRMHTAKAGDWNISLTPRGRWFEVEGQVHLSDDSILTAQQLLQALASSHGGYVQLQNGDYLWLSEKLRKQLDALESITTLENNKPAVPMLQSGVLAQLVNGEIDIHHSDDLVQLRDRIQQADEKDFPPPKNLQATLRPYQLDGFHWMMRLGEWEAGACLADDMGLGKTVQTIAFLLAHAKEGAALVVAPASVVSNWRNELQRFAPTLHIFNLNDCFDRHVTIEKVTRGDVVLATYGLLSPIQEFITKKKWNTVVLDEAHNIKNRGTKTSAVCMKLLASHRIILTGTPVQNHLGELWNLFQFINPGLLGTYEQFHQKFIIPIENLQDTERQQQLQALVAPFMLRRTKQAVVKELPEKTEITIDVELTDDEMAYYEVIRREAEQRFKEEGDQLTVNALAELTRLRRTACSPELTNNAWTDGSSKVNAFMELVQNIIEGDHSVLVFSQFTSFLQIIARTLKEAKLPFLYLDGNVTLKQREQLVSDFQKGKSPIFLISLKAGGVGLNLTAANYVIHLDPWWNPAIEQQATDRAYRIGQKQAVTVYHLISHHTIEEKILRLHESKRALSDSLLEGADKNYKLTAKEMLEMLSNQW